MFCMMSVLLLCVRALYGDDTAIVDDVLERYSRQTSTIKWKPFLNIAGKVQILGKRSFTYRRCEAAKKEVHETGKILFPF